MFENERNLGLAPDRAWEGVGGLIWRRWKADNSAMGHRQGNQEKEEKKLARYEKGEKGKERRC